ncbi:hypothetical protein ScPMuIL_017079 [Solemya velum]
MVAIDINIVFWALALIPLSYGAIDSYYPKRCDANYTECLRDDKDNSLHCEIERVVCLMRYCLAQTKSVLKHQKRSKFEIQRSIAKCLMKHPGKRMIGMAKF